MSTHARPAASTTISLNGCPLGAVRRQVGPGDHAGGGRGDQPAVGQPVDRERQPLDPRHDLAGPVGVEGEHLAGQPVAHPEPAVVPPRRLAHLDAGREDLRHGRCRLPPDGGTHRVRPARAADLKHLAPIEDAGGAAVPRSSSATDDRPDPAQPRRRTGGSGPTSPGFLLVAGPTSGPAGRVRARPGDRRPRPPRAALGAARSTSGRASGRRWSRAAMDEARAAGLRPAQPVHLPRRAVERPVLPRPRVQRGHRARAVRAAAPRARSSELGLDVNGVRVVMSVALR